jgi:transposase InsO family protein
MREQGLEAIAAKKYKPRTNDSKGTLEADIVISALIKATRKGFIKAGAIINSDRGSQYASNGFRELLRIEDFRQPMSGRGNCYDNAQAEVSSRGSS